CKPPNSGALRHFRRPGLVDPRQRRFHGSIAAGHQISTIERNRFVRDNAFAFEPRPGGGDEITVSVNKHVSIWQTIEKRRKPPAPRRLTENSRAADRLHPAGEAFRRAAAHRIDKDRQRTCEWLHTLAARGHEPRIRNETQFFVSRFHDTERHPLAEKMSRDAHEHRSKPAGIAAEIDDDAVSTAKLIDRLLDLRINRR